MIGLAILMGCNPIYINGMDLDYSKGYANTGIAAPADPLWQDCADRQISTFEALNESAKLLGIEIYNLNPKPWYGVFQIGRL